MNTPHTPYLVDRRRCEDLSVGRRLEWLVTNGRGGYASSAVNQMLTRRYHGLLVAAVEPPVLRFVMLAKLEATVSIEGLTYELATNDYPEAVHPTGHRLLESFSTRPFPTWRWRTGDSLIEQTLCMVEGEDATVVRYRLIEGDHEVSMTVRPLGTSRHFHHLNRFDDIGPPNVESAGSMLSFCWPGNRPSWQLSHNGAFRARPDWYYNFVLSLERDRGYDSTQDLFMPGPITATLRRNDPVGLVFTASTTGRGWETHEEAFAAARRRDAVSTDGGARRPRGGAAGELEVLHEALVRAAGDFVVSRGKNNRTVIAGYPWFGDWGRDTFISLPGLCLATGRFEDARRIIEAFAGYVDQGMIPNRFPPYGEAPAYNTADASLWYLQAIERYAAYTGDWSFVTGHRVFSVVSEVLESHERGTRHGIRRGEDGLLAAGESGYALTWMDARVDERSVTPRFGKPVEINALWYNALCIGADCATRRGETSRAKRWLRMAQEVRARFNERFWNEAAGCLYDVVDVDGEAGKNDGAIRPNQLLAISLTHPVLDEERWDAVVSTCQRELLTSVGLRTLSPRDPAYRGRYAGDTASRDLAYHQGTVWPWLLGPFVTAYVRAHGATDQARKAASAFLQGLLSHLGEAGIGGVSEVADGDAPHTPGGCPWQAWSVAEPLRALCEDVLESQPPVRRERAVPERVAETAGKGRG